MLANNKRRYSIGCSMIAVLALVVAAVISINYSDRSRWIYRYNSGELKAIVSRIKLIGGEVGHTRFLVVDRSLDPATLRPQAHETVDLGSCYEISYVQIHKDDYLIEFPVDDRGHFGKYGLLYSDSPPKMVAMGEYRGVEYAFHLPVITGHLTGKWWYAESFGE